MNPRPKRCIASHLRTGQRCERDIGTTLNCRIACVCREHSEMNGVMFAILFETTYAERAELARDRHWDYVREQRRV
jgi:hypothetical protein